MTKIPYLDEPASDPDKVNVLVTMALLALVMLLTAGIIVLIVVL